MSCKSKNQKEMKQMKRICVKSVALSHIHASMCDAGSPSGQLKAVKGLTTPISISTRALCLLWWKP